MKHIRTWIFDLDNTLYGPETGVLNAIDENISHYISQTMGLEPTAAAELRRTYYLDYGATLVGLMERHDICPLDFSEFVYNVNLEPLTPCAATRRHLENLPGRKVIYTNGCAKHVARVLGKLKLTNVFEKVFDKHWAGYRFKPNPEPYGDLLAELGESGTHCLMVEDTPKNLKPAHDLGMTTVLIGGKKDTSKAGESHIQHRAPTLLHWLREMEEKKERVA